MTHAEKVLAVANALWPWYSALTRTGMEDVAEKAVAALDPIYAAEISQARRDGYRDGVADASEESLGLDA